jgi:hypothetical protein
VTGAIMADRGGNLVPAVGTFVGARAQNWLR